jgi:hypothetical protein
MRGIGWTLLVIGFLWLSTATPLLSANLTAAWSDLLGALAANPPLTTEQMAQEITANLDRFERRQPWIFTPACLMLAGGILLSRIPAKP